MTLYVDNRSSRLARTTGWERYNREMYASLRRRLGDGVTELPVHPARIPVQILVDWMQIPAVARGRTVYFPTFPPSIFTCLSAEKVIYTLHDLTWWMYPDAASPGGRQYYRRLASQALKHSQVIITPSHAVASELAASGLVSRDARIEAVYPGPMPDILGGQFHAPRPYLLTVGTLEPRKNLLMLFQAYRASKIAADVDLCVVGRIGWGDMEPPNGVRIVTDADDATLAAAYRGAVGLVFPSIYEGFGLPLIEAARAGIPIACSDIPVFREVTGGHALFFDPNDAAAIASSLTDLVNLDRPSCEARAYAKSFSWDRGAERIVEIVRT